MRIVAIINQKGGCGKTTTSINLAACLARLGQKTLLVDMDPQGHCGVGLAVPEDQIERTIFDALLEERDGRVAKIQEIVWQIASDFDLAPSNLKLAAFEQIFSGRPGREDRLSRALESAASTYQWCIIDCPPSVGLITFNALRACDEAIVPVETGYFSLHGLTKMMETLEEMRERCNKVINIRVLPTLYDTRTKLAREVLSELRAKFRDYLMESTVNFNTKLKEAASFGQPITEYDPGSRGYKDFVGLARELMGYRPAESEPVVEKLSRPQELVQRAKQLAQLSQFQFKGTSVPGAQPAGSQPAVNPAVELPGTSSGNPVMPRTITEPNRLDIPIMQPPAERLPADEAAMIPPLTIDPPSHRMSTTVNLNPDPFIPSAIAGKNGVNRPLSPMAQDKPATPAKGAPEFSTAASRPSIFSLPPAGSGSTAGAFSLPNSIPSLATNLGSFSSVASIAPASIVPTSAAAVTAPAVTTPTVTTPVVSASMAPVKTTEQKIEEFYGVKQLGNEVLFTSKFDTARQVLVAGDFNNWSPMVTPMHRTGKTGEWTMKLPLLPGRYRYRLVVDGRWMTDPHNKYVEVNQFGELNNVVEVE